MGRTKKKNSLNKLERTDSKTQQPSRYYEKILHYLKNIFKFEKLSFGVKLLGSLLAILFGAVGAYYGYKQYELVKIQMDGNVSESEAEKIKHNIDEKVRYIRENFHPEDIDAQLDMTGEFYFYKDLLNSTLKTCALYESLGSTQYVKFKDEKDDYKIGLLKDFANRLIQKEKVADQLIEVAYTLSKPKNTGNINDLSNFNLSKLLELSHLKKNKDSVFVVYRSNFSLYFDLSDFYACLKISEELVNDVNYLKFDEMLLEYIIEIEKLTRFKIKRRIEKMEDEDYDIERDFEENFDKETMIKFLESAFGISKEQIIGDDTTSLNI